MYLSIGQTRSIPNVFLCYIHTVSYHRILGQLSYTMQRDGKENIEVEDVKVTYILYCLWYIIAVELHRRLSMVLHNISPVVHVIDVVYIRKSIPWYGYSPILHQRVSMPGRGTILLFSWMIYATCTLPFTFKRVLCLLPL